MITRWIFAKVAAMSGIASPTSFDKVITGFADLNLHMQCHLALLDNVLERQNSSPSPLLEVCRF